MLLLHWVNVIRDWYSKEISSSDFQPQVLLTFILRSMTFSGSWVAQPVSINNAFPTTETLFPASGMTRLAKSDKMTDLNLRWSPDKPELKWELLSEFKQPRRKACRSNGLTSLFTVPIRRGGLFWSERDVLWNATTLAHTNNGHLSRGEPFLTKGCVLHMLTFWFPLCGLERCRWCQWPSRGGRLGPGQRCSRSRSSSPECSLTSGLCGR